MDWSILRKICVLGFLLSLAIALRPWATCTFSRMNAAQISSIADGGTPGESDVDRLGEAGAFSGGFFGAIPVCYRAYPLGRGDWHWPAVLGFLAGIILFRQLEHHEYVSRVKRATGAHKQLPSRKDEEERPPKKKQRSLDEERADW